jgi:hypothetical protein
MNSFDLLDKYVRVIRHVPSKDFYEKGYLSIEFLHPAFYYRGNSHVVISNYKFASLTTWELKTMLSPFHYYAGVSEDELYKWFLSKLEIAEKTWEPELVEL